MMLREYPVMIHRDLLFMTFREDMHMMHKEDKVMMRRDYLIIMHPGVLAMMQQHPGVPLGHKGMWHHLQTICHTGLQLHQLILEVGTKHQLEVSPDHMGKWQLETTCLTGLQRHQLVLVVCMRHRLELQTLPGDELKIMYLQ
jgi:hypothetical protein